MDGIDFSVGEGERVGFLGPNGAGKTTTLKMLSGPPPPHGGGGHRRGARAAPARAGVPLEDHARHGAEAAAPLGPAAGRDLRAEPRGLRHPARAVRRRPSRSSCELLELGDAGREADPAALARRADEVRARRRAPPPPDACSSSTSRPSASTSRCRRPSASSCSAYNERFGATVLLTSHYMEDVVQLCPRVIVIDRGRLIYDGDLRALALKSARTSGSWCASRTRTAARRGISRASGRWSSSEPGQATIQVAAEEVSGAVARMLGALADRGPHRRGPAARGGDVGAVPSVAGAVGGGARPGVSARGRAQGSADESEEPRQPAPRLRAAFGRATLGVNGKEPAARLYINDGTGRRSRRTARSPSATRTPALARRGRRAGARARTSRRRGSTASSRACSSAPRRSRRPR